MAKLMIEDVKCGFSEGGMACGPVDGPVIVEAKVRDLGTNEVSYHTISELGGSYNFNWLDESTIDEQIKEDYDNKAFWDKIDRAFEGCYSDYEDFLTDQETKEVCGEDRALIWRYLVYMVNASTDDFEKMKAMSVGKCLGDFEIPVDTMD